jgi:ABC-type nitrate/sulfonate/bicarbonate transport system substrate-binding protein
MAAKGSRFWFAIFLTVAIFSSICVEAAQRELIKLTVGYTPISGATLPFYVALEEKFFQKHGFEVSPVFMGGSPLINSAILAGEFPIGTQAAARSSRAVSPAAT